MFQCRLDLLRKYKIDLFEEAQETLCHLKFITEMMKCLAGKQNGRNLNNVPNPGAELSRPA